MKTIEEKAKAYDEAISRAKVKIAGVDRKDRVYYVNDIEEIFPELKESEDDKIRKELLEHCRKQAEMYNTLLTAKEYSKVQSWLAWLEKQGNLMKCLQISNSKIGDLIEENYYLRENLEKQCKNNMGISETTKQKLEDNLNKALEKETPESCTKFLEKQGEQKSVNVDYISGIRKELLNIEDNAENIDGLTESQWVAIRAAHRLLGEYITKEHSCSWSEEDKNMIEAIEALCDDKIRFTKFHDVKEHAYTVKNWLKSLKDRVQTKQEWSEEDEKRIKKVMHILSLDGRLSNKELSDINDWLKSLKDRYTWKPNDEQMKQLKRYCPDNRPLTSLYEQLKKLREE